MIGPTTILVTRSSATHCRPWEDGSEHICAIARTHSDMVKFGPHDPRSRNLERHDNVPSLGNERPPHW